MNWTILKQKAIGIWRSIPPKWQGTIVVGASATSTFMGDKLSEYLFDPAAACWSWPCLRHTIAAAVLAGVVAARTFFMRPGPGPKALPAPDPAK